MGIFIKIKKLFGTGSFEADDVQIDVTNEKEQKKLEKEQKKKRITCYGPGSDFQKGPGLFGGDD
jgi:hypothetical protein